MLIKRAADIRSSEITDKKLYLNRREFLGTTAATAAIVRVTPRPAINLGPMIDFAGLRGDAVLAEANRVLASAAADDIAVLRSMLDRQYSES